MITIETDKCIHCGLCELLCPAGAIGNNDIADDTCIKCGECRRKCPETAINTRV